MKIITESVGYLTIEAVEDFEDTVNGEKIKVKAGERRIVPVDEVHKQKMLPPKVKEHAYELGMEKKLKRLVAEKERNKPT